jgi:16S rRNA (uracil1498-N3)-methyltransferase
MTSRTVAGRVNLERMRANVVEASEQCNLVHVPEVLAPEKLEQILATWETGRSLVYCDETMLDSNPLESLRTLRTPAAVLVGPEGGFTGEEKAQLKSWLETGEPMIFPDGWTLDLWLARTCPTA